MSAVLRIEVPCDPSRSRCGIVVSRHALFRRVEAELGEENAATSLNSQEVCEAVTRLIQSEFACAQPIYGDLIQLIAHPMRIQGLYTPHKLRPLRWLESNHLRRPFLKIRRPQSQEAIGSHYWYGEYWFVVANGTMKTVIRLTDAQQKPLERAFPSWRAPHDVASLTEVLRQYNRNATDSVVPISQERPHQDIPRLHAITRQEYRLSASVPGWFRSREARMIVLVLSDSSASALNADKLNELASSARKLASTNGTQPTRYLDGRLHVSDNAEEWVQLPKAPSVDWDHTHGHKLPRVALQWWDHFFRMPPPNMRQMLLVVTPETARTLLEILGSDLAKSAVAKSLRSGSVFELRWKRQLAVSFTMLNSI